PAQPPDRGPGAGTLRARRSGSAGRRHAAPLLGCARKEQDRVGGTMAGLKRRGFVAAAAGLGLAPALARGQAYPNKQVRVVVPYPAGGGTDLVARLIMPRLAERWKQSVIIDNKGGASGILGSDIVAK